MRNRLRRPDRAYATIPNAVARDANLSIEARGVLILLMTYADNWEFRADHIRTVAGGIGRDKFARIMRELSDAGYVERRTKQGNDGKLGGSEWIIRDEPDRLTENPSLGGTDPLKTRQSGKPTVGKPAPIRKPKEQENQSVCSADAVQHTQSAFDEFWKGYPRPKDLDATERAFAQAVADGADPAAIIAGAKAYAAENEGNGSMYLKHSANWLKAQGWLDHAPAGSAQRNDTSADVVKANYARAIAKGHASVARHCPVPMALELIAAKAVTQDQCRAVGVSV